MDVSFLTEEGDYGYGGYSHWNKGVPKDGKNYNHWKTQ